LELHLKSYPLFQFICRESEEYHAQNLAAESQISLLIDPGH